ncbi:MAG: carotenoid biosynthesis protein [Candidatus Methylomirabilales bacterium]
MSEVPGLLLGSLWLRPYVFGFLGVHLLGATAWLGGRRAAAYTLITWAVAFLAESSSIRTGVPFGWYYYVPDTAGQELWIAGVPFFDSLSFSFLLVSSYGLAWVWLVPRAGRKAGERLGGLRHALLTTALFVLIDMIIDPVALRGDRWFLGRIYGYPEPGAYFGVPLANFVGWAVVGLTATGLYLAWERREPPRPVPAWRGRAWLCPGLYFVVLAFNLGVTFAIGEWALGLCGLALAGAVAGGTLLALRRRAGARREEGMQA